MKNKLIGLNEKQKAFVLCEDKKIVLLACAGSGKTRVVSRKVGILLENRVPSEKIFAISFTRAAAKELKNRIMKVDKEGKYVNTCTFHSFVISFIQKYKNQDVNIISDYEKEIVLDDICKRFSISNRKLLIDAYKKSVVNSNKNLQYAINEYIFRLKHLKLMDIDLLLPLFLNMLNTDEELLNNIRDDIEYLFYDEAQDINKLQYEILTKIIEPSLDKGFVLIGDDDQNIYQWNNTSVDYILGFEKVFKASKFILDENYRCSNQVIMASNSLISNNNVRESKVIKGFFDADPICISEFENEQQEILRLVGKASEYIESDTDLAILCRSNKEIKDITKMFEEFEIPFNTSIKVEFDKEQINLLKIISNPLNDILIEKYFEVSKDIKINALETGENLIKIIINNTNLADKERANKIMILNTAIKRMTALVAITKIAEVFELNIDSNILKSLKFWTNSLPKGETNSLNTFLNYLESKDSQEALKEGYSNVYVTTIHGSKGLEFEEVVIYNLNDSNYKFARDIEETRRLLYVGLTRAKSKLNLFFSKNTFAYNGYTQVTDISKFVSEMNIK